MNRQVTGRQPTGRGPASPGGSPYEIPLLAFWFILLSIPSALLAQDTASITGTVTDPSGAAVAGAQVTREPRARHQPRHTNGAEAILFGAVPGGSTT